MEPQKIGRYEIKAELGRGGMATVYQAYDPRFEREVAIKVLPREMLHDRNFRLRFEREAKTIAMLEHPAIVPVYDFGEEDGQPYFVMRFMTGGSLSERVKRGPLPIQEAARLLQRLAPALDEAHAKGIIHRDLKPGNILFDAHNEPYVSDFGIAKLSETQTNVTGSAIVGTPAYMSPEQAQGQTVDGRSDVYALGNILFEMLTGRQAFLGDTPMSVVVKHITDPIPHILDIKADLPPAIESVIEKAMAKDRDERFPTARALADALAAVARGEVPDLKTLPSAARVSSTKTTIATSPADKKTVIAKRGEQIQVPAGVEPRKTGGLWLTLGGAGVLVIIAVVVVLILFRNRIPFLAGAVPTQTQAVILGGSTLPAIPPTQTFPPPASPTSAPTDTLALPSETPAASPTPSAAAGPVLGGADMIAFLGGNDVWVMRVDGTDLRQLTNDRAERHELQWMPDGQTLVYISGTCIQTVSAVIKGLPSRIACFEGAEFLEAFRVSPDGKQVAISLNRQLFVVPLDLKALESARTRTQLMAMKGCFTYGTQANESGTKGARWSSDGTKLAVGIVGVDAGRQVDLIRVFDLSTCDPHTGTPPAPKWLDTFPAARFKMNGYSDNPTIPAFDWNGQSLFLLNSLIRNKWFGYQYTYNLETHRGDMLDPLGSGCCYTDMHWSPDGSYVIFGYQNYNLGAGAITELYYVPYGTITAGGSYTPLPLPANMFNHPRQHPDAALRPAKK